MSNLLTLSVILLGISLVRVDCQPAPPVTELYFDSNVYKEPNGYTKFYYSQKGYSERVYVNFNGAELRNGCTVYQTYTNYLGSISGWKYECLVKGTNGVLVISTAGGSIYGRNYNRMSFNTEQSN